MFNIKWVVLFFFFQIVKPSQMYFESKDIFHQTDDRILEIIDHVFISLKIDENFKKSKNVADYFLMHNYIQDAVEKNEQVYKNIRSTFKTNVSNKTAYSNLNFNEVIDEAISEQLDITFTQILKNNSKIRTIPDNAILNEFMELARDFLLKISLPVPNDFEFLVSDFKSLHRISRRLLRRTVTTIKKFPFMVSIHVRNHFTCAGTLIREDMVIAAASCLIQFISDDSDAASIYVRVNSDYTKKFGELLPVADLIFHSDFNSTNLKNNLVIIRLKRSVKLGKNVLINYDTIADDLPEGVDVFFLGWGEKMNNIGGPAVVGDTLVGVISFSSPNCGQPEIPTVFTKIGFYANWIASVFKAFPLQLTQNEPYMMTSADPALNSTVKKTSKKNYIHNVDVKDDLFNQTTKQGIRVSLKPDPVAPVAVFTKEQTNPTPSPFIKPLEPSPLAADNSMEKLDWNFVDNIFDRLIDVANNHKTSISPTTTIEKVTPVVSKNPTNIFVGEYASYMTSSSLNIVKSTPNTPFTENSEDYYSGESNKEYIQSAFENDHEIIDAKVNLAYKKEESDNNVEVVIKELGTTKRFVLDKKEADARESLAIIREKLSNYDPDMLWTEYMIKT